MTTTDAELHSAANGAARQTRDASRAARLAALHARRGLAPREADERQADARTAGTEPGATADATPQSPLGSRTRRRQRPALVARVVTSGVSASLFFGVVAALAADAERSTTGAQPAAAGSTPSPPAASPVAPVIIVVRRIHRTVTAASPPDPAPSPAAPIPPAAVAVTPTPEPPAPAPPPAPVCEGSPCP